MFRLHRAVVPLALLFLASGMPASAQSSAERAQRPAGSPDVRLSITLPDGHTQDVTTHESGLATLMVNGREYGFRPTLHDDQGNRITVTVFQMGTATEAVRELGEAQVTGGGAAVSSGTTPAFKVRAAKAPAAGKASEQ